MGTNSIKKNLTKDSIISNIKLLLGADIEKKKAFIVVEGEDDIKFLRKFVEENVTLYESFSGKCGVEEIVNSNEICDFRVIGIRDKDYCSDVNNNRIFFYDRCCLEMMIVDYDESFDSIYCEFYKGETTLTDLKKHILNELFKVSKARKYNEENKIGINFNGLSFQKIIDNEYKLDKEKFIQQLKKLNSGKSIDFNNINNIINESESLERFNLLDITNGHDFIFFFKVICHKNCDRNYANEKEISSVLRGSFGKNSLKKTNLYKNVNHYFDNKIRIWCG